MALADLRHYIRTYDDSLDAALCARMIASFHGLERFHAENGANVRRGLEESRWTELNVSRYADAAFLGMFRRTIEAALARYNADVGLGIAVPDSGTNSDLVMKRYRPGGGEKFQLHFDAVNHVANRYLVMLWYLNDVAEGGETRFPQLDFAIAPRAGRLLVFPPYWMYQHEGVPPASGDKYIVSTYLLFTAHPAS
ncbi:MAG TPA: 2OG-Fe(II) oxygenase [Steroidobacteraceae bacterium]|nr:2OG-Fe(II) oxygenase [Steroidobacteraceae bacterium]HNS26921.1 2OG-Fe(II) oxygenase [Steroidobacteraceae bacterium]